MRVTSGVNSMPEPVSISEAAEGYLPTLVFGQSRSLVQLLGAGAIIADPRAGRVAGAEAVERFSRELQACIEPWMPRLQHLRTTITKRRACCEDILRLDLDGEAVELPVATVVSPNVAGDSFLVRVYYSLRPFDRCQVARGALFPAAEPEVEFGAHPDVVAECVEHLRSGELNAALACLEADIYVRGAGGPCDTCFGTSAVRDYLVGLCAKGIPSIHLQRITDDGRCAAIEFSLARGAAQPPEGERDAGLVVFERSEDRLIRAIRLYFDMILCPPKAH